MSSIPRRLACLTAVALIVALAAAAGSTVEVIRLPGHLAPAGLPSGGTVSIPINGDPRMFNPFSVTDLDSILTVNRLFGVRLFWRDPLDFSWIPFLAETVSLAENGRVLDISIRQGFRWSDGRPIGVSDVLFSAEAHLDPEVGSRDRALLTPGDRPVRFEQTGPHSFRVTFPESVANPYALVNFRIGPRHALEGLHRAGVLRTAWGLGVEPSALVTSGPFILERFLPGDRVILGAHPGYRAAVRDSGGAPLPRVDRTVLRILPDPSARQAAFLAGAIDLWYPPDRDAVAATARAIATGGLQAQLVAGAGPTTTFEYLAFNWDHADPWLAQLFRRREFRLAVSHLLDRAAIVQLALGGLGRPARSALLPHSPLVSPEPLGWEFDPQRALGLLAEIGFSRGADGRLVDATGRQLDFEVRAAAGETLRIVTAQVLAEDAARIGARVRVAVIDRTTLLADMRPQPGSPHRPFDAALGGLTGVDLDVPTNPNLWEFHGRFRYWHTRLAQVEPFEVALDDLSRRIRTTVSAEVRRELVREFERIYALHIPLIPTVLRDFHVAHSNRLLGLAPAGRMSGINFGYADDGTGVTLAIRR